MNLQIYGKQFMDFEWLNHKLIIAANENNSKTTFKIRWKKLKLIEIYFMFSPVILPDPVSQ